MTNSLWATWTFISAMSLITSYPMINSVWVTLTLISAMNLITSHPMTNSVWVTLTFISAMHSHHISPHDQQHVSDTDIDICHIVSSDLTPWPTGCEWYIMPCSLIRSHPMSNSMWVILTIIYAMQSHQWLTPWPTACEWHDHWFMLLVQSHHVSPHDQQIVSDTDIYAMPCCFIITSHPMTNSLWVTLTFMLCHAGLITSHPMTNSNLYVCISFLVYHSKAISSHLINRK